MIKHHCYVSDLALQPACHMIVIRRVSQFGTGYAVSSDSRPVGVTSLRRCFCVVSMFGRRQLFAVRGAGLQSHLRCSQHRSLARGLFEYAARRPSACLLGVKVSDYNLQIMEFAPGVRHAFQFRDASREPLPCSRRNRRSPACGASYRGRCGSGQRLPNNPSLSKRDVPRHVPGILKLATRCLDGTLSTCAVHWKTSRRWVERLDRDPCAPVILYLQRAK